MKKIKTENRNFIIPYDALTKILESDSFIKCDSLALYTFYFYTIKKNRGRKVPITNQIVIEQLQMSLKKIQDAKKLLKGLDLIEFGVARNEFSGRLTEAAVTLKKVKSPVYVSEVKRVRKKVNTIRIK